MCTAEQNETAGVAATNRMTNILFFIGSDESLPLNTNIFKNSFQAGAATLEGFDFDENRLAFAFAALGEPGGEALGEALGSEAVAGFDAAVGDGERVVEVCGVGEIAHTELVEPIERARLFLAMDDDIDGELLRVHAPILASPDLRKRREGRNLRECGASHRLKFEEEKRCGRRSSL